MKIRADFVTNSSSSSFIIGQKDDSLTKDSIFQIMKDAHINLKNIWTKFKETYNYNESHFNYKMWDNIKLRYRFDEYKRFLEANNIDTTDIGPGYNTRQYMIENDPVWIQYKTYDEYESTVLKGTKEPLFLIYDLKDDKIIPDHDKYEIVDWFGWGYDGDDYCYTAGKEEYFGSESERAKDIDKFYVPKTIDNLCVMGHILVSSEHGCLPEYIVDKLYDISNYACNHMG